MVVKTIRGRILLSFGAPVLLHLAGPVNRDNHCRLFLFGHHDPQQIHFPIFEPQSRLVNPTGRAGFVDKSLFRVRRATLECASCGLIEFRFGSVASDSLSCLNRPSRTSTTSSGKRPVALPNWTTPSRPPGSCS